MQEALGSLQLTLVGLAPSDLAPFAPLTPERGKQKLVPKSGSFNLISAWIPLPQSLVWSRHTLYFQ